MHDVSLAEIGSVLVGMLDDDNDDDDDDDMLDDGGVVNDDEAAIGMLFIGVVCIGLETRFDNDFIGDCSNVSAGSGRYGKAINWSDFGDFVGVCCGIVGDC